MPTRTYSKYRNIKSNGYDSRKEERRHKELLLLEKSGQIEKLKNQVKYELIPSQKNRWQSGRKSRVLHRRLYLLRRRTFGSRRCKKRDYKKESGLYHQEKIDAL